MKPRIHAPCAACVVVFLLQEALFSQAQPSASENIAKLIQGLSGGAPDQVERSSGELERMALEAGRPGAENERKALSQAIADNVARADIPAPARIYLVQALEAIGKGEAVAALGKLLSPEVDPLLRDAARRALEANPNVNAKRELRKALQAAQGKFKIAVINSLGNRRDNLASIDLMEIAEDKDPEVRLAAMNALALIGDVSAVSVVESALKELQGPHLARLEGIYLLLADTLAKGGERGAARRIYLKALGMGPVLRAAALVGIARTDLKMEMKRVIEALDDPDPRIRGAALEAAAMLSGEEVTKALSERLDGAKDPSVKVMILSALARRKAAPPLIKAAGSAEEPQVRAAAIRELGELGAGAAPAKDLIPVLLEAIDKGGEPAEAAEAVLSGLSGKTVTEALSGALGGAAAPRRLAVLRILGARRDPAGAKAIQESLKDPDPQVRVAALQSLGSLGDPAFAALLLDAVRSEQGAERDAAASGLGRMRGEEVTRRILAALESEKGAARAPLLKVLGSRKAPEALPLLEAAASEPEPAVRQAALEGLALYDDPSVLPLLVEAAEKGSGEIQRVAVKGCLRLGDLLARDKRDEAGRIYLKALDLAKEGEELAVALRGVGEVCGPDALEKLVPLLKPGPVQRDAGRAALRLAERLPDEKQASAKETYQRILSLDVDDATATQCVRRLRRLGVDIDFAHKAGFVTRWWILGPIPNPEGALWEKPLAPETSVDLVGEVKHGDRSFKWRLYHNPNPRGLLNLNEVEGFAETSCAAYLYAEVSVPEACDALFKIGSDDQVICWLSGVRIHAFKANRGLAADQDSVEVKLAKGANKVLLKVFNDGGPWGACLRITDRGGKPLEFTQRAE